MHSNFNDLKRDIMTQEEILEYNKRCAEFLEWKEVLDNLNIGDEKELFFKTSFYREYWSEGNGICQEGWVNTDLFKTKHLLFHSDWNWIMKVVEAIEREKFSFEIRTLWFEFNECSYTQVIVSKEVGEMSKDRKTISNSVKIYKKSSPRSTNKKEEVIRAINDVLIWIEQNK